MPFLTLLSSPLIKYGAIIVTLLGAFTWYTLHERAIGEAKVQAAVAAATQAEQSREQTVNNYWQTWAQGAALNADQQKATISGLQKQIAVGAARNTVACLPANTVKLLNAIGSGSQANTHASTGKPNR